MPELSTLTGVIAAAIEPYAEAQPAVLSRGVSVPPFVPEGSRYLVPVGATGAWANHAQEIAERVPGGWSFFVAEVGVSTWVQDERLELFFDGTHWVQDAGATGGVGSRAALTDANKRMQGRPTFIDGDLACDVGLALTPTSGTIMVLVNGLTISEIGNGAKAGAACYFSVDGGVTALSLSNLVSGAQLFWNGSIALYQLSETDVIDFVYEA